MYANYTPIEALEKQPDPNLYRDLQNDVNNKIEWELVHYANSADPQVWGPSFWFILHNGAARYPDNPSPFYKERMKGFILGMPVMIPCAVCAAHATSHIEDTWDELDAVVSCKINLFKFFVDFHNKVNQRYNKDLMNYQDAYDLYTGVTTVKRMKYKN